MKSISHNDLDGKCSSFVVAKFAGEKMCKNKNFINTDYEYDWDSLIKIVENGETIFITDLSFKERTKWVLDALLEKKCNVIWIDHHTSSLNLIEKYPYLSPGNGKIRGIVSDKHAGCMLTYMYLFDVDEEAVPRYIKRVSDYDTWQFLYDDTDAFKLGLDLYPNEWYNNVWSLLDEGFVYNHVVSAGKVVQNYIDRDFKNYRDKWMYESEIDGHKALIINRKENSWIFGEYYDKYPIVCTFGFDGEKFNYSLYSGDKTVDCSKIAESYGGGGHRGAAGFRSDKILFKKI